MKKEALLFLLVSFLSCPLGGMLLAQSSGFAKYRVYGQGGGLDGYIALLDFSPVRSYYRGESYTGNVRTKAKKKEYRREGDEVVVSSGITSHVEDVCVAMDRQRDQLESYKWIVRGDSELFEYITYGPIPKISWQLVDTVKQFGRYAARGARCAFRGREYMVWYVPEVPVGFGPWKFNGLPGLIVEASEANGGMYRFVLAELEVKEGHKVPEAVFPKQAKRLPIATYAYYHDNRAADLRDIAKARAPRGVKVTVEVEGDGGDDFDVERNFKDLEK